MKKGELYEGKVEKMEFPNKGILTYKEGENESKVTVKGALPGQTVRFRLSKKHGERCEGRLLEVLEKSALEDRESLCPHFEECAGCSLQNMSYDTQLKLKGDMVKSILDDVCGEYLYEGISGSPMEIGYRNKMEFSFGDEYKDGPLALGLHKKGGFYDIVTVDQCQIVPSDYNIVLHCVLEFFQDKEVSYYHKMRHTGYLRHLVVRRAFRTGEILVNLITSSQYGECGESKSKDEQKMLSEFSEKLLSRDYFGKIVGILHTYNDSLADVVQSDKTEILHGRDYIVEKILGLNFKISAFSFFQTNSMGAEVLYGKVREYVGETKDKVVFDLYSGTGTIAQMLAAVAKKVIGVEIVEEAVEAARVNAGINKLENCEFIAGDVLKVVGEIDEKPDVIVLDPPRDGVHPRALEKIAEFGVEKIVYVSCKPTSLGRDLEVLIEKGYKVEKGCCVDMFAQTYNIETVCLLSKLHADQHIEVELQMDELDLTAAESKATYEEIKDYVLEHTGLKVNSLYIAQVKEKCGIIERVNYNQPKSENSRQPKCPPEKETAIREALEYFRMI
ncbi:MAG: 23S rRNA (uracil(1939)-C(5))-methyltransferase RlmD [Lachnospiraceae bacterium]|nr:23S rRNA (uracil(1939)-C(5))-methyltransferase RlmD [Lachnospiraceae bacterium]